MNEDEDYKFDYEVSQFVAFMIFFILLGSLGFVLFHIFIYIYGG